MFLSGTGIDDVDENGVPIHDDNLLLLLNASVLDVDFTLPRFEAHWELLVDTAAPQNTEIADSGHKTLMRARSLKLFRCCQKVDPRP